MHWPGRLGDRSVYDRSNLAVLAVQDRAKQTPVTARHVADNDPAQWKDCNAKQWRPSDLVTQMMARRSNTCKGTQEFPPGNRGDSHA